MGEHTKSISDANFDQDVMKSEIPVLVDFWAPWCGPCLSIAPALEALAQEYQGRVVIAKVNTDENAHAPAEFGVRSIPSLFMIKNGKVIDSENRAVPKARLKEMIEKSLV